MRLMNHDDSVSSAIIRQTTKDFYTLYTSTLQFRHLR